MERRPIRIFTIWGVSNMTQIKWRRWSSPSIMNRILWSSRWNRRSTIKVRWAGFGESCDSWKPCKVLLHVDKLHDYLRANAMRILISSKHKLYVRRIVFKFFLEITYITSVILHTSRAYNILESGGPSPEKRGYWDTVEHTGTLCTGIVRTYYYSSSGVYYQQFRLFMFHLSFYIHLFLCSFIFTSTYYLFKLIKQSVIPRKSKTAQSNLLYCTRTTLRQHQFNM